MPGLLLWPQRGFVRVIFKIDRDDVTPVLTLQPLSAMTRTCAGHYFADAACSAGLPIPCRKCSVSSAKRDEAEVQIARSVTNSFLDASRLDIVVYPSLKLLT
jgi:hypothetical protein